MAVSDPASPLVHPVALPLKFMGWSAGVAVQSGVLAAAAWQLSVSDPFGLPNLCLS